MFLKLLKSTLLMLGLGHKIKHYNILTKYPLMQQYCKDDYWFFHKYQHNKIFDR